LSGAYRLHRLNAAVGVPSNALCLPFNSLACLGFIVKLSELRGGRNSSKQGFHREISTAKQKEIALYSFIFNLFLIFNQKIKNATFSLGLNRFC